MRSRLAAALATMVGLLAAGLVAVAAPAAATETQPEPVCEATWKMRGATGAYPNVTFGGPPPGSTVADHFAKLTKPSEGIDPGVEFAAFDLEIQAPADNELLVGVDYATDDGATTAAGAVRLFGYKVNNADTLNDAPTYGPAVASSESGHLVLTVPAGEKLGTLGMVYDASNSSSGSVTFSNLKIGTRSVLFTGCPEPEPTASATPTAAPTQTATPKPQDCQAYLYTGTRENLCKDFPGDQDRSCGEVKYRVDLVSDDRDPWDLDGLSGGDRGVVGVGCEANPLKPTESAAPVPTLPVTGSSTTLWLALAGACALGAGALLYALARRRRVQFRA